MSKSIILIIEDDRELNAALAEIVTTCNYEALQAYDGQMALDLLSQCKILPALVICDLKMPVMGGIEFIRQSILKNLDLNICLISGNDEKQEIVQGLQLGVIDYIEKPIGLKLLRDKLKLMVDIGKRSNQIKLRLMDNDVVNVSIRLNNLMKMKKGLVHEK